jgi:hypothetical protein
MNINGFRGRQMRLGDLLVSLDKVKIVCIQEHRIYSEIEGDLSY